METRPSSPLLKRRVPKRRSLRLARRWLSRKKLPYWHEETDGEVSYLDVAQRQFHVFPHVVAFAQYLGWKERP